MRFILGMLLATTMLAAAEQPTKKKAKPRTSHWTVSYELLGSGVLGSITGSYWLAGPLVVNLGAGYISNEDETTVGRTQVDNSFTPVAIFYPSALFAFGSSDRHYMEFLGGLDYAIGRVFVSDEEGATVTFIKDSLTPIAGIGYRYWKPRGGFHFRFTGYYFISTGATHSSAWVGMTLGYGF